MILVVRLTSLEDKFDDELSKSILSTSIDSIVDPRTVVAKSLYNFDLESTDGVTRLLELLPILDDEIANQVYQEVFPGYPVDTLSPRMAKLELRGYFMDYLYDIQSDSEGGYAASAEGGSQASSSEEPVESAQPDQTEAPSPGVPAEGDQVTPEI